MTDTNTPQETGFEDKRHVLTGFEREILQAEQNNPDNYESNDEIDFNYAYNKQLKVYRSGEKAAKGNYSCTNCGTDITLSAGRRIPMCPRCGNTEFDKVS
ncbi:MAG: zinc ribbon-containing protein [Clostridiales bacterium]|jgi:DNA-directed RNA polymerase subunit RPC12/RpoP|nr:zinc ribbon-containing protein [Clostridiales bacterium]